MTPWTTAHQAPLSFRISQSLLKFISTELMMLSNHLILCHPLLLLPSIFPSIRVFSNELVLLIKWPKCWSFSFSISLSNEHSGLISFRIDWFDLVVQGTLESSPTLQFKSINSSVLSFLYGPTLTSIHLYMTTGKTIALTRWTFGCNVSAFLVQCLALSLIYLQGESIFFFFYFHGCNHHFFFFYLP